MLTGIIRIEQDQISPQVKTSLFRLRMEGNNIEYLGGRDGSIKIANCRKNSN